MPAGKGEAVVAVAAEIEVGITQAWNSDDPRKAWPARAAPAPFLEWCTIKSALGFRQFLLRGLNKYAWN